MLLIHENIRYLILITFCLIKNKFLHKYFSKLFSISFWPCNNFVCSFICMFLFFFKPTFAALVFQNLLPETAHAFLTFPHSG